MPPIRSPKGKAADTAGTGQSTGPAARPRKRQKDNSDPCEICGIVVSRKSDLPRHAKTHASEADKLPCTWEGCKFRTRQKSNLETHIRRHTQDKMFHCKDAPETCHFTSCDPASLLRHRKRMHDYIPRSAAPKPKKPKKTVPIRVIRAVETGAAEGSSSALASQFSKFPTSPSAEASTSKPSSSRRRPTTPPESASPSPTSTPSPSPSPPPRLSPIPSPSSSASPPPSRPQLPNLPLPPPPPPAPSRSRVFSPANSSGESEVSRSTTPIIPTPHQTPEGSSSTTVLFATLPPVYYHPTGKEKDQWYRSLLFAQSTSKDYVPGLSLVDDHQHLFTTPSSELLESLMASAASGPGEYLGYHQYSQDGSGMYGTMPSMPTGDEINFYSPSPPLSESSGGADNNAVWHGDQTMEQLNGVGLEEIMNGGPFMQTHHNNNSPVEGFYQNASDNNDGNVVAYCCCLQPLPIPSDRPGLGTCSKCNLAILRFDFDIVSCPGGGQVDNDLSLDGFAGVVGNHHHHHHHHQIFSNNENMNHSHCGYNINSGSDSGGGGGGGGSSNVSPHASGYANNVFVAHNGVYAVADGELDELELFESR